MLEYFSLAILIAGGMLTFYAFIYIHDLPYEAAKHRNHPHLEAIHVACVLSLFTLHAIWPIVYIWAVSYHGPSEAAGGDAERVARLEERLAKLENRNLGA